MKTYEQTDLLIDGAYQDLFNDFIAFKKGLGFSYGKSIQGRLRELSRFLAGKEELSEVVSREYYEEFCARRGSEKAANQSLRMAYTRQFCLFLQTRGYSCFVPLDCQCKQDESFMPYIISEEEMALILTVADSRGSYGKTTYGHLIFPMLIRMLWCCGLRIGEAIALTIGDVDLQAGILRIVNGKNNRDRLVPMSRTCTNHARVYWDSMGFDHLDSSSLFFPSPRGGKYSQAGASGRVKEMMAKAGIRTSEGKVPRTHDIRHSYAVRALQKMEDEGTDLYCSLPLLSIYMGHHNIKSTEYYLRLTESGARRIEQKMAKAYEDFFPEVNGHE